MSKKSLILGFGVLFVLGIPAFCGPILLNNTGAGVSLGAVDPNWILQPGPGNYPTYATDPTSTSYPIPPWLANDANSKWISPKPVYSPGDTDPTGYFVFRTSFTLSASDNPSSVSITGRWIADNWGVDIYVNGAIYSPTQSTPTDTFTTWTPFSLSGSSGLFTTGVNTLDFVVRNQDAGPGGPTGLRVEFLSATVSEIPEPATVGLLGLGLVAMGIVARRRKKA